VAPSPEPPLFSFFLLFIRTTSGKGKVHFLVEFYDPPFDRHLRPSPTFLKNGFTLAEKGEFPSLSGTGKKPRRVRRPFLSFPMNFFLPFSSSFPGL